MTRNYLSREKMEKKIAMRNKASKFVPTKLFVPPVTSVKNKCTQIYDQGELSSCTANAFCSAYTILENVKNGSVTFEPSRLFVYYYERLVEDSYNPNYVADTGADVTDGENYVLTNGICSETSWPYSASNVNVEPPQQCNIEAINHKIKSYSTIPLDGNLINNIKLAINNSTPVLIAIQVYDSFESDFTSSTGIVTIPKSTESNLGGHEMCLVGYTESKRLFTVLNSWGSSWGNGGFCYIPYDYLSNPNLGMQFTVISL
ncbi:MAG: peptidase C1 [Edafosvirus sp.]|uniref:Peptidase C1 n=1 Tax=Edafosvirus sp. TaxID=2487765 RepID=A0A3G4ZTV3_9VIRU|nr:MAG: peptidase C1 [Edafosvirus sp.]